MLFRSEFVQNTIHKAMNARATGTFRPAPSHGDVADQLERLEGLRDRGALTDFPAWADDTGNEIVASGEEEGALVFFVRKGA